MTSNGANAALRLSISWSLRFITPTTAEPIATISEAIATNGFAFMTVKNVFKVVVPVDMIADNAELALPNPVVCCIASVTLSV